MESPSYPQNGSGKRNQTAIQEPNSGKGGAFKAKRKTKDNRRIKKLRAAGFLNADSVAVRNLNEHQVPRNDNDNDMPRKHTKRERRRQRLMWISKQVARPQTWEGEGIFRRAMGFDGSDDTYNINDDIEEVIEVKYSWVWMDVVEKADWIKSETGGKEVAYTYDTIIGPSLVQDLVLPYRPR